MVSDIIEKKNYLEQSIESKSGQTSLILTLQWTFFLAILDFSNIEIKYAYVH